MISPLLLARLRRHGIVYPVYTYTAAHRARLGLPLACAILMQETAGGRNEFGHDPTIFVGAGAVTAAKYRAYLILRNRVHEYQGVGPCQLTSPGLQDQADKLGGCYRPLHNMTVGFKFLHDLIVQHHDLRAGVEAYNGTGPAAVRYADHVLTLTEWFKGRKCGTVVGVY